MGNTTSEPTQYQETIKTQEEIDFDNDVKTVGQLVNENKFEETLPILQKYTKKQIQHIINWNLTDEFAIFLWQSDYSSHIWEKLESFQADNLGVYIYNTYKDNLDTLSYHNKTYREWCIHLLTKSHGSRIFKSEDPNEIIDYMHMLLDLNLGDIISNQSDNIMKLPNETIKTILLDDYIAKHIKFNVAKFIGMRYLKNDIDMISFVLTLDVKIDLTQHIYSYPHDNYLVSMLFEGDKSLLKQILDSGKVILGPSDDKLSDHVALSRFFIEYLQHDTKNGLDLAITCIDMVAKTDYTEWYNDTTEYYEHVKIIEKIINEKYANEYSNLYNTTLKYRGCHRNSKYINNIYRLFYESLPIQSSYIMVK